LDISRAPTTSELMAAGQLGGLLHPTHEIKDKTKEDDVNLSFGSAIDAWNRHEYPQAVQMFRQHMADYPDSPWAAEAALHIGCDATYNGRYSEAEAIFQKLIADQQAQDHPGAKMLLNKARQRLALVKVSQNNLEAAGELFRELKQDSPDWRHRTYASHWIQRLSRYAANKQALLNCGGQALASILRGQDREAAAREVESLVPATEQGHSLRSLVDLAGRYGFQASAIRVSMSELKSVPLPAIVQIGARNPGDKGHYWVLEKAGEDQVELFDPQSRGRFRQTTTEFVREWNSIVIAFSASDLPGVKLADAEMEQFSGGCCGVPRPPSDTGDPGRNATDNKPRECGNGAPSWTVNVVNMNLYVTDTPLWYDNPIGPSVRISLSYNSQSSITYNEPFGNKWQFNYASYLVVDTGGNVTIFMPDGRYDVFTPNGSGGYNRGYRVYNTLTKIAENHFELRFPDDTVYVYNIPAGTSSLQPFLVEIRDAHGQSLTFTYNANVQLTTVTDALGRNTTLTYNGDGLVTQVADPFGRTASFEYDANRNLTKITDMGGYWSTLGYDQDVYLTSIGDDRGTWTFWIEPADGIATERNTDNYPPPGDFMWENYRITVTNPVGGVEEYFFYGGCGCYSWYVAPRDYVPWQSDQIDNFRLPVPKTMYWNTTTSSGQRGEIRQIDYPGGGSVNYGYDTTTGDRTSVTDAHEHTWYYSYNSMGRVTSIIDPRGVTNWFSYATNNVDLVAISNALGAVSMAYNAQHDITSTADRLTNTTSFAYNSYGQIISQVDALSVTNGYSYNPSHQLTSLARTGQTLETYTYDAVGRVRTHADATGLTLTYDYNGLNEVTKITCPDAKFETYTYSSCCPHIVDIITDRAGRTTSYVYDELKRRTQITNPEGGLIRYGYDANGNRTELTDPNGNVTSFDYNLDDRLIKKTYADGKFISFAYDSTGLLTNRVNGRGMSATFTYDANHNLLTTSYSDGTPGVTNTCDNFNRVIQQLDAIGTNSYTYDANSRPLSFDGPWTNDTLMYAYDALGRRTNLVVQLGQTIDYSYDRLNRLTTVQVDTNSYLYGYSGVSPLVGTLTRPNTSYTTNQYDSLNRLTVISNRRGDGEIINQFTYTYNAQDLRGSEIITNGLPFSFTTNEHLTYNHNNLNQLLSSAPPDKLFAYDDDGNMTRGYAPDGYVWTASYDAENRLKSLVYTNGSGSLCSNVYVYAGNAFLGEAMEYQNDALSNETRFVRDGLLSVQERDVTNTVTRECAWGLNMGGGIGGLLNLRQNGLDYSYLYDGKGNVMVLVDGTQTVAASYVYDAFGKLMAKTGTLDQPIRYSTKPYHEQSGLSYYGYRFYSAALGRWISRDPLGEEGNLNLYGFVANDPLSNVDPLGLLQIKFHRDLIICRDGKTYTVLGFQDKDIISLDETLPWYDLSSTFVHELAHYLLPNVKGVAIGHQFENVFNTLLGGRIFWDRKAQERIWGNIINPYE
jgi:RHS repeat-associated protein